MTLRFAWPTYTENWDLNALEVSIDSPTAPRVNREGLRIDVTSCTGWATLTSNVTVRTMETLDAPSRSLTCYVLVNSPATNLRTPVLLKVLRRQTFGGTVVLRREELAGQVGLTAVVVAEIDGIQREVGQSAAWTVVVDPAAAPSPPGAPPFEMVWRDFSDSTAPQMLRSHPGALSVMDVSSVPTLYLNSGIDGLQAVLTSEGAKLEKRRLRDILGTRIARDAAASLFRAAAADVVAPEDAHSVPQEALQRQVCEAVAAAMDQVVDVQGLYERLWSAEQSGGSERALFWMEVDAALDAIAGVPDAVAAAVQEVKYA